MNKVMITGNLTRDPESRVTQGDRAVCNFTVAVNRFTRSGHPEADYFRVAVWDEQGKACQRYLAKGRKVLVNGRVTASAYIDREGNARAQLEVTAQEVEFLSPRGSEPEGEQEAEAPRDGQSGMAVVEDDEMPF